jgi:hypothetical protein
VYSYTYVTLSLTCNLIYMIFTRWIYQKETIDLPKRVLYRVSRAFHVKNNGNHTQQMHDSDNQNPLESLRILWNPRIPESWNQLFPPWEKQTEKREKKSFLSLATRKIYRNKKKEECFSCFGNIIIRAKNIF